MRCALQRAPPAVHQEVSNMTRPAVRASVAGGARGEFGGLARHVFFGYRAALGDLLDRVAVAVARGKIHRRIDAGRVGPKRLFHHAHRLDKIAPFRRREEAQDRKSTRLHSSHPLHDALPISEELAASSAALRATSSSDIGLRLAISSTAWR